jgi:hypothetical protein
MVSNPVIKPKVATPALVLASVAVVVFAAFVPAVTWPGSASLSTVWAALVVFTAIIGTLWLVRERRRRVWLLGAKEKWNRLEDAKRTHGTTAEITVLSIDALEPTGAWITVNWNRFGYVQPAWLEALAEPIWAGSVLLITPDPAQVRPSAPWPAIYYIQAASFLAWAPDKEGLSRVRRERLSSSMSFK